MTIYETINIALISKNELLAAVVCLILLLIVLILWRRRVKSISPPSPPPTVPSLPTTTGPFLESSSTTGDPRRFDLNPNGTIIGRSLENDLVITKDFPEWETVSQRHAWIYRWVDHWIVEDIDSMNGIQVNGKRTGHNLLRDGWQLDIGGVEFVFRAATEETEQ